MPPELTPKEQVVRGWLAKASNDLESARCLLDRQAPILDTACFHCQQAAEKALKALLILHEREPPRTHSIGVLLDVGVDCDRRLAGLRADCEWLTAYAVETRYPDSAAEPTLEKAGEALRGAEELFRLIVEIVPPQVRP